MRTPSLPLRRLKFLAAAIVFALLQKEALAQEERFVEKGIIRIKVTEELAGRLESSAFRQAATGELVIGITSLDQLNHQHKVRGMTRLFRHAGKNEERHRRHGLHLWYELEIDTATSVSDAIRAFQSHRDIIRAERVYEKNMYGSGRRSINREVVDVRLSNANLPDGSNDPRLRFQWHYHNTGQTGGTPGADIHLLNAWKSETGSKEVIVAVMDAGIQTNHRDLAPNIWVNEDEIPTNGIDDDDNGYVDDVHGYSFATNSGAIPPHNHGTHVGGTIGAVSNNRVGVAGIAGGSGAGDGIQVMTCAIFSDQRAGGIAESFVYAADNGAVISQNSWGYSLPGRVEQAVLDAIDYFIEEAGKDETGHQIGPMAGGLVIFSAGNANSEGFYYPGFYEPVLAVAASTHTDLKAAYSNYGTWVDVTAPGGETHIMADQGVLSTLAGGGYGYLMGTSMASPHVSGVAALVLSKFTRPGFTSDLLKQRIIYSVDNIDGLNPTYAGKLGKGRINAERALQEGDEIPPSRIKNLKVAGTDIGTVILTWTSPSDNSGFTSGYDLRYSTSPITAQNFSSATQFTNTSLPRQPGFMETLRVNDLPEGVLLYFAIRSIDFEGNVSLLSNVVSGTPAFRPSIMITSASITETLSTAQQSVRTFTIRNNGKGPLEFLLKDTSPKETFAIAAPVEGVVLPAREQVINISFDASGLTAGTYQKDFLIENNDPATPTLSVAITLQVRNNNAPIAIVAPSAVDFKSVQVATMSTRIVTISNAGSEPLVIRAAASNNPRFTVAFTDVVTLQAFAKVDFRIMYSPDVVRGTSGKITFSTNDPANSTLIVSVAGEGIADPPIIAVPDAFHEKLHQGATVNRALLLTNNGSHDVTYRIDMANIRPVNKNSLSADTSDFTRAKQRQHRERMEEIYAAKSPEQRKLLRVSGMPTSASRVKSSQWKYTTGFEDFTVGPLEDQKGWSSSNSFFISRENPDKGFQHVRGAINFSTGDAYAFSPWLGEDGEFPPYSYMIVRLNIPPSASNWDVIPLGGLNAAIIRFNADRTIDAIVGEDDYNTRWERLPFTTPEGYFELAIALKNEFSDTTFNPYYSAFINHQHIFSGVGISSQINAVAFTGDISEHAAIDIDELEYGPGEFVPHFIKPDAGSGVIPAGESVNVNLKFDAGGIDFGSFEADLLVFIEEYDSLVVPVKLDVTGAGGIVVHPTQNDILRISANKNEEASAEMTISNTGGRPVQYHLESVIPNLHFIPASGTLAIRETKSFTVTYDGRPGIFIDEFRIHTDFSSEPIRRAVEVKVIDSATLFYAPRTVSLEVPQGQLSTHTFQVRNDGLNTVSFHTSAIGPVSVDPTNGSVAQEPSTITLTIDGRVMTTDQRNTLIEFRTNDSNQEYFYTGLRTSLIPDAAHYGKITQEIWTNVPGNKISSIPVHTPPSRTHVLNYFEAPRNQGDLFGSRFRGYVIPLYSGEYSFWICSNDNSELWLSSDDSPAHKRKIASVTGFTEPLQYDKYPSQQSEPIYLDQNKRYYIEALHKEVVGADHITVAWKLPNGKIESPIPGIRLVRYEERPNQAPTITFKNPRPEEVFPANSSVDIRADARDADGKIVKVEFFNGSEKLGIDITSPYTVSWKKAAPGSYTLIANALDNLGGTHSDTVDILVSEAPSCAEAGYIVREQWNNVTGTAISVIPLQRSPSLTETLTAFEASRNVGDYYGTRIRGFLCPPQSGQYIFWIASNDKSELWLSTDQSPSNKIKIAYVSGYTDYQQWSKYPSQQSALITLEAGRRYYVEALHKEVVGTDHLSVGWQLPDRKTMERPIQGTRLLPFYPSANKPPTVVIRAPSEGARYTEPATIRIDADAWDDDGRITRVEFFNGTQKLGEDLTEPYSITVENLASGSYTLTAVATDASGSITSAVRHIHVATICSLVGTITREYWTGIPGNLVAFIPVNDPPDGSESLTIFEGPDANINYGARIHGYICPPVTGDYHFWIASNDNSELWLSTDENENNKVRIASVTGATNQREWNKFATQKSSAIHLTQDTPYYIEALHKQGVGTDHVAVGWRLPDGTLERPIGGNRLSPARSLSAAGLSSARSAGVWEEESIRVGIYPNPVTERRLTIDVVMKEITTPVSRRIEILQLTGLSVYSMTDFCDGDCPAEIDLPDHLPPGIYILQVTMRGRTVTKKLFIR